MDRTPAVDDTEQEDTPMAKAGWAALAVTAALVYGVTQIDATTSTPETEPDPEPEVTTTYEVEPGREWLVVAVDTVTDVVTCADATRPRGTSPGKSVTVDHPTALVLAARYEAYYAGAPMRQPACPEDKGGQG